MLFAKNIMTPRERLVETLLYGAPDRIPLHPGKPRESTLRAWHSQGLRSDEDYLPQVLQHLNRERERRGLRPVDFGAPNNAIDPGVSFKMIPEFEEKVLRHENGHYIVQDWMGAITEISDAYDLTYLRMPRDFVTRKWHKFPVEGPNDWDRMRPRFDASTPGRFADDFEDRCAALRKRDYPFILSVNGPFWQLREFCGMENLCMMMYEQPDLISEMAAFWMNFCSEVMARLYDKAVPDMLLISEDMAFKAHPMISPEMTETFCAPCYEKWVRQGRAAGMKLFSIDSDGYNGPLLPVWIKCGINCMEPIEVAAGNDLTNIRRKYGTSLAFCGGIDKRAMAAGGETLKAELERLAPVIQGGGYIPACDHGVPPDVSWPNYLSCTIQLAELTGWLR